MGLVEAKPQYTCDTSCGRAITLEGGRTLESHNWLVMSWQTKSEKRSRLIICPPCREKLERDKVIKKALHNTSISGKFGPETDCG